MLWLLSISEACYIGVYFKLHRGPNSKEVTMDADHNPAAAWCVRGVRLPDGDTVEEWWIADGVWRAEPVAGASDLPGGWFLPDGLVDAHAHLTMNQSGHRLPGGSDALIAANLAWPVAPPRPRRAPAHRPGRSHHAATPT